VIKSLAYFPSQCALNSAPVMSAILNSVKSAGVVTCENSTTADAVVIWSVLWSGRMAANQTVYQQYKNSGRPVIVVDIGTLQRGVTWKIAVNNITSQGYYGHHDNLDWQRPRQLGLRLKTATHSNSAVLVAAQHTSSLQLTGVNQTAWIAQTVQQIRNFTDRPIHVRPHPRCRLNLQMLPDNIQLLQPKKLAGTYDSYDIDYNYHAVVNYNSGPGIQAAIAGARPIVDISSLAAPVGIDIADIETPYTIDRDLWLVQIAHTEYTLEELYQGTWINRIQAAL
jgi:hypothetical protein